MTITVKLSHDYSFPAEQVWAIATDLDHLRTVTNGLLTFRDMPSGRIHEGQHLKVQVSLFGKLPYQPYEMTVVTCDQANMSFQSEEVGAGVKSWRHALIVVPTKSGSRIEEEITIDAGITTWILAAWARFLYRKRHAPRLHILEALAKQQTLAFSDQTNGQFSATTHSVNGFHAHVYFDDASQDAAAALCNQAAKLFDVELGQMHVRPIGPHPMPSCQLDCTNEKFCALLPWLMENRGDLSILCHAKTTNHLHDHTRNAFWLGEPQTLDLRLFK